MDTHKISKAEFCIVDEQTACRLAVVDIDSSSMSSSKLGTLIDTRMGTLNSLEKCPTCSNTSDKCTGHFGIFKLPFKIMHPFFHVYTLNILKLFCLSCCKLVAKTIKHARPKSCPHCTTIMPKIQVKEGNLYFDGKLWTHKSVYECLKKVSPTTMSKFGVKMNLDTYFVSQMLIPPIRIRPFNNVFNTNYHDEITTKLLSVLKSKSEGELFINMASYQFQDSITKSRGRSNHSLESKSLASRWKGKKGRIRGNLMGKRINYTARTVISPGPDIALNEIGVPHQIAQTLTKVEYITCYNICHWQSVINSRHHSVLFIIKDNGVKIKLNKHKSIVTLRIGWKLMRCLKDGDMVLMNRQPSLHRYSVMAHKVKIVPTKTFQLNLSCTPTYNADFDGDEMNCHAVQGEDANTEALTLMNVNQQIGSAQSSSANMSLVQDSMLGVYLISLKNVFLKRCQVFEILYDVDVELLPPPTILKPKPLWTGKDILSVLIPRFYEYKDDTTFIHNGKFMYGLSKKKIFGNDRKGIAYHIHRLISSEKASEYIMKWQRLSRNYIDMTGISVTPRFLFNSDNQEKASFKDFLRKQSKPQDKDILIYTEKIANMTKTQDDYDMIENMVKSGAKGKEFNLMQIKGCVGQQTIMGKIFTLPLPSYTSKTLPILKDKAFIVSSYTEGLTEEEHFVHAISGREGVIDTSVKTADTGYLHRKMTKTMESFTVYYDKTVRGHGKNIVQFLYGADNFDASKLDLWTYTVKTCKEVWEMGLEEDITRLFCRHLFCYQGQTVLLALPFQVFNLRSCRHRCGVHCKAVTFDVIHEFFNRIMLNFNHGSLLAYLASELVDMSKFNICAETWNCFEDTAITLLHGALVSAGEMVGMLAVGSIGEPCTQMTLNSFHSCGIGNAAVSVGIPRLKDIIDVKVNSDPFLIVSDKLENLFIAYYLSNKHCVGDICKIWPKTHQDGRKIEAYFRCHVDINDDIVVIHFKKNSEAELLACHAIMQKHPLLKSYLPLSMQLGVLVGRDLSTLSKNTPLSQNNALHQSNLYFTREKFHKNLDSILVRKKDYVQLLYEDVLSNDFVSTYDIYLAFESFGTEFCNLTIFNEITKIISSGGTVNSRHILLVSDVMVMHGSLHAFHRHAFQKIKSVNTFEQASFEQTVDCFKKSAFFNHKFDLCSVSDNIICGQLFTGGTNAMTLIELKTESHIKEKKEVKIIKTIIRREWSIEENNDDPCPTSPNYCPSSPLYCPSSPAYMMQDDDSTEDDENYIVGVGGVVHLEKNTTKIEDTYNFEQASSEDTFRINMMNSLNSLFEPPSPHIDVVTNQITTEKSIVEKSEDAYQFIKKMLNL